MMKPSLPLSALVEILPNSPVHFVDIGLLYGQPQRARALFRVLRELLGPNVAAIVRRVRRNSGTSAPQVRGVCVEVAGPCGRP